MAYCNNCGKEIPAGVKFCGNCGAPVNVADNTSETTGDKGFNEMPIGADRYTGITAPRQDSNASSDGKITKFLGIGLLILTIIDFFTDPPALTIALAVMIIIGCIVCLAKKFKLNGFTIAALVIACLCIGAAVFQGVQYGWLETPDNVELFGSSGKKSSKRKIDPKYANVDPDLIEFLSGYEDFVDEYVDFMKKYLADPMNVLSMLTEYNDIMKKYNEFADKIDKYDSSKMSALDAEYYLEVTTRCTQKMLNIYN